LAGRLCYGGDYNPEQWPEDVWREDVALMRQCGVNLVTVGVFAWSRLEPREGEYEFGWLDRVLDLLHDGGIRVSLATPTASPPPWFTFAYPDALPETASGVRLRHGSRDTYCASAPAYQEACRRVASVLAQRYADHPALALWHVHNEYGTWCHCGHVAASFRRWLRDRYGSLDALNEAWTTSFWSQHYADWEHILPPRATQYLANPSQLLDFRRFVSDELLTRFVEQRDILKASTPDVPVTTNFALGPWVPVNQWRWAREVDIVAIDHYPSSGDSLGAEEETAFAADLARGFAGGAPWLVMEQAPHHITVRGRMRPKSPGQLARLSLSYVARGSVGAMFFQWRASRGGAEMFHSAMVPHAGPATRAFAEVAAFGTELSRLSERVATAFAGQASGGFASRVAAGVALVWDPESWWALQGPGLPAPDLDYWAAVRSVHASAWRIGVTVDVVAPGADLSHYRVVLVPCLFLADQSAAGAVETVVRQGGHAVVWYLSGVAGTDGRVHPGGYPGPFRDLLGLQVEQHVPLPEGVSVALSTGGSGSLWSELLHLRGATVVATYADGDLAGEPAITRHAVAGGVAWYVATHLDDAARDALLGGVFRAANVPVEPGAGGGVELVRRRNGTVFAINHTSREAQLPLCGMDVLTGSVANGELWLGPGRAAVVAPAS